MDNVVMLWSVNRSTCAESGSLAVFAADRDAACAVAAYYHGGRAWEYMAEPVPLQAALENKE